MFRPISPRLNTVNLEEQILGYWRLHRTISKSIQHRQGSPEFTFYEGPPAANELPQVQHALAFAFKDLFSRYKLMRGYHVVRRGGWQTHGLQVETSAKNQLGFSSRGQIESYGIDRFNDVCRRLAFEHIQEWERFNDRLAFWADMQEAYVTYTNEYIESAWWLLKSLWDKGLLYQGNKVEPYCPHCETLLSEYEIKKISRTPQSQARQEIYVRLPLADNPGTSLLVWTADPWTLTGNVAVAVNPEGDYVTIEHLSPDSGKERLVLARDLVEEIFGDESIKIVDRFKGKKLKGRRYQPLFRYLIPDRPAYFIVLQHSVSTKKGSGLVHIAPAFGVEDMQAASEHNLPLLQPVNSVGVFLPEVRPWSNQFVGSAEPLIIQDLQMRGLLFRSNSSANHRRVCWRCSSPPLNLIRSAWYIRTSHLRNRLSALEEEIHWLPSPAGLKPIGSWLASDRDWAVSRENYWGIPLPFWECEKCHSQLAVGSVEELAKLAGRDLFKLDLHRPYIDEIIFPCPQCGKKAGNLMHRAPDIIHEWFDSGAMPWAQWHYPFENRDLSHHQFPADLVSEVIGCDNGLSAAEFSKRGWMFAMHVIGGMLFDSVAFKNILSIEALPGSSAFSDGSRIADRRADIIQSPQSDAWEVFNSFGADAFRWWLYGTNTPAKKQRCLADQQSLVVRKFMQPLWNIYVFFVTNANLCGWRPDQNVEQSKAPGSSPAYQLDRWLRSALASLVVDVTSAFDHCDTASAAGAIQAFVWDLSSWYLRRSRRRFRKSAAMEEKQAAFSALYESLVILSKLMAPAMPFLAEVLYQNLVRSVDRSAPESVHLCDWPQLNEASLAEIDPELNNAMCLARKLASLGHAARMKAGIKLRQPLAEAAFVLRKPEDLRTFDLLGDLLAEELNVSQVRLIDVAGEAVTYQLVPLPELLGKKYKGLFPKVRMAILAMDPSEAGRAFLAGKSVSIKMEDDQQQSLALQILPDEVDVRLAFEAGGAAAKDRAYQVVLQTELTSELVQEGMVREFLHGVQSLRKQADLEFADRIRLFVVATPRLAAVLRSRREEILRETRAVELLEGSLPPGAVTTNIGFKAADNAGIADHVMIGLVKVDVDPES